MEEDRTRNIQERINNKWDGYKHKLKNLWINLDIFEMIKLLINLYAIIYILLVSLIEKGVKILSPIPSHLVSSLFSSYHQSPWYPALIPIPTYPSQHPHLNISWWNGRLRWLSCGPTYSSVAIHITWLDIVFYFYLNDFVDIMLWLIYFIYSIPILHE